MLTMCKNCLRWVCVVCVVCVVCEVCVVCSVCSVCRRSLRSVCRNSLRVGMGQIEWAAVGQPYVLKREMNLLQKVQMKSEYAPHSIICTHPSIYITDRDAI